MIFPGEDCVCSLGDFPIEQIQEDEEEFQAPDCVVLSWNVKT
jgi:hypothetical protein